MFHVRQMPCQEIWIPPRVREVVGRVRAALGEGVEVGTHFHNDFGLALANTLVALEAGATCPTAAVNGLGERAGNTDLAQLAAATACLLRLSHGVDLGKLRELSREVERRTGILVGQNAAVVGHNAFTHTSGIHVHGMLRDASTYEPIDPALFGACARLALGKHSGRNHIRHLLGGDAGGSEARVGAVLAAVKRMAVSRSRKEAALRLAEEFERFNREVLTLETREVLDEAAKEPER
jgi:isopropylmalate/homocitrate/citramalate synthase